LFFFPSFSRFSRQAGGNAVNGYRPLASRRCFSGGGVIVRGTPLTPCHSLFRIPTFRHSVPASRHFVTTPTPRDTSSVPLVSLQCRSTTSDSFCVPARSRSLDLPEPSLRVPTRCSVTWRDASSSRFSFRCLRHLDALCVHSGATPLLSVFHSRSRSRLRSRLRLRFRFRIPTPTSTSVPSGYSFMFISFIPSIPSLLFHSFYDILPCHSFCACYVAPVIYREPTYRGSPSFPLWIPCRYVCMY